MTVPLGHTFGARLTDVHAELVIAVANRVSVVPAIGDHQDQRLATTLGACPHKLDSLVVLVLVNFVDQGAVWTRARLAIVGTDRAKE